MAEFIEILSPSALKDLNTLNSELLKTVESVTQVNKLMGGASTPGGSNKAINDLNKSYQEQERIISTLQTKLDAASKKQEANAERNRLAEIRLAQQREKAFDKYDQQLNKEQQKLNAAAQLYNKVQAKLNSLQAEYKNLAVQKQLTNKLTDDEQKRYDFLAARITKYDTALKAVDASMGKHQRNVGNYASGFNALSGSINQLTREAPAFANSVQTGFMAISNNLPIFFDAIQSTQKEIKALRAEGQKVPGLFSQLTSSLLGWGTVLSVGVTLLTIFGDEIVDWTKSLFNASDAIDSVKESQKQLSDATQEGVKNAVKDQLSSKILLETAKDVNLSYKERSIAVEKLQQQYPFYFENLTKEQIMAGDTAKAEMELNKALLARAKAQAAVSKITENQSKIIDIEFELAKAQEEVTKATDKQRESAKALNNVYTAGGETVALNSARDARALQSSKEKVADLQKQKKAYESVNDTLTKYATTNEKVAIGLDYNKDKEKEKRERVEKDIDFEKQRVKNQFDLLIAEAEAEREQTRIILADEKKSYDDRLNAQNDYVNQSIKILLLQRQKEQALLAEKTADELKKNIEARDKALKANQENIKDGFSDKRTEIEQTYLNNITVINQNHKNDLLLIEADYSKKWQDMLTKDTEFYNKIQSEKAKLTKETGDILFSMEQERLRKESEDTRKSFKEREVYFQEWKANALEQIDINEKLAISQSNQSPEQLAKISAEFDKMRQEIEDVDSVMEKLRKETDAWEDQMISGFFGNAGFPTLFKALNGEIAGFGQNFKDTMLASMEIAQEAFGFISQQSNAHYENEKNNLAAQKDIALKFAGDSAAAREKIEEEYDQKKRLIDARQAKAKQKQALFNIAIDTAQAVIAAVAKSPETFGLPFSAFALAIGAAQAAFVQSQAIPEFYTGTDNAPGGLAWTDERGAEIHTDKHGNIKDFGSDGGARMKYLEKGDKIFTAHETKKLLNQGNFDAQLNQILTSRDISTPVVVNNGITPAQMDEIMSKHLGSQTKQSIKFDRNGFSRYISKNGNITRSSESRGGGKGLNV